MLPLKHTDILVALGRIEAEMRLRLDNDPDSQAERYSPFAEVDCSKEVDGICTEVAQELARRQRKELPNAIRRLSAKLAELVIWRLRDAQRHVRETRTTHWHAGADPEGLFERLLVESWHTYAESYWMERLERCSETAAAEAA